MKKIVVLSLLVASIYSCSKKVTPSTQVADKPSEKVVEQTVVTPPANTPDLASGKSTYEAKCGKCHELKKPEEYTAARWVGLVGWMAGKAKLTDTEKADVLAYVQANAKKS